MSTSPGTRTGASLRAVAGKLGTRVTSGRKGWAAAGEGVYQGGSVLALTLSSGPIFLPGQALPPQDQAARGTHLATSDVHSGRYSRAGAQEGRVQTALPEQRHCCGRTWGLGAGLQLFALGPGSLLNTRGTKGETAQHQNDQW